MPAAQRLLIVDDAPTQCNVYKRIITHFFPALSITSVGNGYDTLAAYQHERPNLIILDNQLPDILGVDLIGHMRATRITTPILLVSGFTNVNRPAEDRYTHYLPKPIPLIELVDTITQGLTGGWHHQTLLVGTT